MKKVFKMFAAAIALAFAAVACDSDQKEIVPDEATYAIFTEAYNALTDQYSTNTAATILNTDYKDEKYAAVVDSFTLVFTAIEAKIEDLKATADAFYAKNVLADHIEELTAAILDLKVELEKAVEDFGAEITAIDEEEAAYAIFTEAYNALTDQYSTDTAATILNTDYEDEKYAAVVDSFTLVFTAIEAKIKDLKATADTFYADHVLADHIEELTAAILDLKVELEKAVEDFGAEITAIDEAYAGNNWVKLGVGTLTEPFTTMFGEDPLVINVDVYQDSYHPGLYMYKGVGLQLANWFYEQDMSAYEGNYWKDEGIIFDATDPNKVVIVNQPYGFNAGSSYGWPVITTVANGQTVGYGKLANGHLTLTAREYLVGMGTSYYYGPAGYDLALPSAAPSNVAPSKVNYVEKGKRSERTLVSAPASAR